MSGYLSGETWADSYIASRYRRPAGDSPVRHVRCTCLGKTLPCLAARRLLFPQGFVCLYNIPYCSIIELPIHISPHIRILTNPFGRIAGSILPQSTMPPKTRSTPAPTLDGNMPAIQWQSASASNADENAKNTPAASKPPSESQDQTFTNTKDQFDLYT